MGKRKNPTRTIEMKDCAKLFGPALECLGYEFLGIQGGLGYKTPFYFCPLDAKLLSPNDFLSDLINSVSCNQPIQFLLITRFGGFYQLLDCRRGVD